MSGPEIAARLFGREKAGDAERRDELSGALEKIVGVKKNAGPRAEIADEDVLGDSHFRNDLGFLMNDADAVCLGLAS